MVAGGKVSEAARLHGKRDAEAAFGQAMSRTFALRPEVLTLATADTIVCRCEDIRFADIKAQVAPQSGWTDAKLQTRCGMGSCQGRICGSALQAIFGWQNVSVRPPLFPVPIAALCSAPLNRHSSHSLLKETSQ